MDNMIEHPWIELQVLIKEKWLTQKAFSSILWKKVSEVNELLKWKRNITIQRDYLLHQTLWTPIKYWILKQVDYDYSLLDIDESSNSPLDKEELGEIWSHPEQNSDDNFTPLWGGDAEGRGGWLHQTSHSEQSEVYSASWESTEHQTSHSEPEERENPSNATPMDFSLQSKWQGKPEDEIQVASLDKGDTVKPGKFEQSQETPVQEQKNENDEDFKKRANIFKTF